MLTKYCLLILLFLTGLTSCKQDCNPDKFLSEKDQDTLLLQLIQYMDKKPSGIKLQERFDIEHLAYYKNRMKNFKLVSYYKQEEDSVAFFLILRKVYSLYDFDKRAVGGRVRLDANKRITFLKEEYVGPIQYDEVATANGKEVLRELITNGSIDKYLGKLEYVEFPNVSWEYNQTKNAWVMKGLDKDKLKAGI